MKSKKSLTISFLVVIASFGVFNQSIQAEEPAVSQTSIRQRTKELHENVGAEWTEEEIAAATEEFNKLTTEEACAERTRNLSARIEFYRNNQDELTDAYEQIHINAAEASAKFLGQEFDTKDLDKKIAGLEDDLFALKSSYFSLIDILEQNLAITCDDPDSEETYAEINTLKDATELIKTLQENTTEVRKQALSVLSEMQELKTPNSDEAEEGEE